MAAPIGRRPSVDSPDPASPLVYAGVTSHVVFPDKCIRAACACVCVRARAYVHVHTHVYVHIVYVEVAECAECFLFSETRERACSIARWEYARERAQTSGYVLRICAGRGGGGGEARANASAKNLEW